MGRSDEQRACIGRTFVSFTYRTRLKFIEVKKTDCCEIGTPDIRTANFRFRKIARMPKKNGRYVAHSLPVLLEPGAFQPAYLSSKPWLSRLA